MEDSQGTSLWMVNGMPFSLRAMWGMRAKADGVADMSLTDILLLSGVMACFGAADRCRVHLCAMRLENDPSQRVQANLRACSGYLI